MKWTELVESIHRPPTLSTTINSFLLLLLAAKNYSAADNSTSTPSDNSHSFLHWLLTLSVRLWMNDTFPSFLVYSHSKQTERPGWDVLVIIETYFDKRRLTSSLDDDANRDADAGRACVCHGYFCSPPTPKVWGCNCVVSEERYIF